MVSRGKVVATWTHHNTGLLMFLLRARRPEKYGAVRVGDLREGHPVYEALKVRWEAERAAADAARADGARASLRAKLLGMREAVLREAGLREEALREEGPGGAGPSPAGDSLPPADGEE